MEGKGLTGTFLAFHVVKLGYLVKSSANLQLLIACNKIWIWVKEERLQRDNNVW